MRLRPSVVVLLILLVASPALALQVPERPAGYVVDLAGIVQDGVEMKLNGYLKELEQKTTAQVVVLTLASLEGGSLEDVSLMVAERWALGQRGKDNGLLILVALKERRYRFEVGYGLEGVLPDSLVGSIGREFIVPNFRKGDYQTGIAAAALASAGEIARQSGVEITGMPKVRYGPGRYPKRGKPTVLGFILSILFFIGVVYMFIKHPRLMLLMLLMSGMGGRRGHWGGGGGFGGAGFGGGGGGGFGGGGASGGW
jgi:uncharacterized protein